MLDIEQLEKLVDDLALLVILAKKVGEDKKVDLKDLPAVIAIAPKLPGIVEDFAKIKVAVDEAKDLDISEVIVLIQKVAAKVKEVEQA